MPSGGLRAQPPAGSTPASEGPEALNRRDATRLPLLLTAEEAGRLLRTSRKAIYAMVERGQLPGVIRLGRRVLFRAADLLDWLDQKRAPSPKE